MKILSWNLPRCIGRVLYANIFKRTHFYSMHTHTRFYTQMLSQTDTHTHRRAPLYDKQTHAHSDRPLRSLWPLPSRLGMPLPTFATACVMLIQPLKNATDEAINGFILLASFQKITLCTSKSQTDPIDLFCAILFRHAANWWSKGSMCINKSQTVSVDLSAAVPHSNAKKRDATQTLLHTVLLHKHFYTQTLLHTNPFTHNPFLHTIAFTHKNVYTQTLVHRNTSRHKRFYTPTLLNTSRHKRFYTPTILQTRLHANAFTHKFFYTQTLLHTILLHTNTFTHKRFTPKSFRPQPTSTLVRKGCRRGCKIAILHQFFTLKPHFVRKGCCGVESQFYVSFWHSNHFVRKGGRRRGCKIAILLQFLP